MTENLAVSTAIGTLAEKTQYSRKKRRQEADFDPSRIVHLDLTKIKPNRAQPRINFESNATIRLADSIRRYGILQPLTVRISSKKQQSGESLPHYSCEESALENKNSTEPDATFELVAGERRFRAAQMLGLKSVPCIIIDADDKKSAELALIENLLREDLNIFETAVAIDKLIRAFRLTQEEVAKRLSMSQSAVANKLRLLKFSEEERAILLKYGLTERHARALLKLSEKEQRLSVIEHIVAYHLNVSATEVYIERLLTEKDQYSESSISEECGNGRKKPVIKDIRLFYNSVAHAIDIVKAAGIDISSKRHEDENGILIEIRIGKKE